MTRQRVGLGMTGAVVLVTGWALGAQALALPGLALVVLAGAAGLWRAAARRRLRVERAPLPVRALEGTPLSYDVTLRSGRELPGSLTFTDRIGGVPTPPVRLRRTRPSMTSVVVPSLHRGIHVVGPGEIEAVDPLGLTRTTVPVAPAATLIVVRPILPQLESTFLEGAGVGNSRRHPEVRVGGTEPHGIREHRAGESLRAVHWASSARRGRLMVRELEEPPADDVTIVLDLGVDAVVGPPGQTNLDTAVRAAGALALAARRRPQRVGLALAGVELHRIAVSDDATWETALDALAGAQGTTEAGLGRALRGTAANAVLVTTRPVTRLVDDLLAHRAAGVVAVDTPTFAGAAPTQADPGLLRLAARGVPVAVLRAGAGFDALGPPVRSSEAAVGE